MPQRKFGSEGEEAGFEPTINHLKIHFPNLANSGVQKMLYPGLPKDRLRVRQPNTQGISIDCSYGFTSQHLLDSYCVLSIGASLF